MKKYGFGVDIGGTTCKIGLFEVSGKLLDKWEIRTNTQNNGSSILSDVAKALEKKMEEKGISKDEVQGIGVGVPGPIKSDGTVNRCVNLGWDVFNVADSLTTKIALPVRVGNDANVAALGEMWQGGGKGHKDMVMVTLGTGVGGGIIIEGKMVSGAAGAGGELGHIMVAEDEEEVCGCGKHGCLEQYASATGIVRLAKRRLASEEDASVLRDCKELTAKEVFDAAKQGDKLAIDVTEQFGVILGKALANIACVVNPEVFVIGGGVSKAGQIILDIIRKNFITNAFHACMNTEFALATLGNDAGIYGCMQMVLEMGEN